MIKNNSFMGKVKHLFPFLLKYLILEICIILFLISLYKIIDYHYETYQSISKNENIMELINKEKFEYSFYEKYKELLEKNSDMIGWISIEGTKLNYPVMQTKDDEKYYLRRNFDKEYEFRGTLFVNKEADLTKTNDNIIIYGHNMDDGTMFGTLRKYLKESFYEKHRFINFETINGSFIYEIVFVFKTVDEKNHASYIDYSNFFNIDNVKNYQKQIELYKNASLYEVLKLPKHGDELLTLSTCEYSHDNGRLVIIANKIKERR